MVARRLTGFLVAFLMLHLTFVGASVRCAPGSELNVVGHHYANGHHSGMSGMAMDGRAHAAMPSQSHQVPAQPECCRAMAACAVTVALCEEAPSSHARLRDDAIVANLIDVPRSPITSPDPPPPKA